MQPTKQQTRDWLLNRSTAKTPPPDIETIRRELGFDLIPNKKPQPQGPK